MLNYCLIIFLLGTLFLCLFVINKSHFPVNLFNELVDSTSEILNTLVTWTKLKNMLYERDNSIRL